MLVRRNLEYSTKFYEFKSMATQRPVRDPSAPEIDSPEDHRDLTVKKLRSQK